MAANLSDLVEVLDAFNTYRYQQDPEQLAVWDAARAVMGHSPRRSSTPPPSTTDSGTSPSASPDGTTKAA